MINIIIFFFFFNLAFKYFALDMPGEVYLNVVRNKWDSYFFYGHI